MGGADLGSEEITVVVMAICCHSSWTQQAVLEEAAPYGDFGRVCACCFFQMIM